MQNFPHNFFIPCIDSSFILQKIDANPQEVNDTKKIFIISIRPLDLTPFGIKLK